jgi:hypothetical protein
LALFILGAALSLKLVQSAGLNQSENKVQAAALVPNDLADYIEAIALDDSGAIYVVGKTTSEYFPLVNPFQSTYGGGESDGFIAVFAPDGQSLQYSTYIGGSDFDIIKDIAISDSGRIVVTGATGSADFPLDNPYQPNIAGFSDGFVMVFEPDFLGLTYSTFIGGARWDYPTDMTIASDGSIHLTGYTDSLDYPVLNPVQTYQGNYDVFVTGFSPDGQSLTYSTYIGGAEDEQVYEIVLDSNGRKYITGYTESPNFPTANAYQPTHGGLWDGFVTILNQNGQTIEMSTFLGGSFSDSSQSIQLDSNNRIYVGGSTGSADFPVVNPYQPVKHAGGDSFLTIFNTDWQSLAYSTFLGGNQGDSLQSIILDDLGRIFMVGYTYSTDFPLTNPLQSNNNGAHDVFVTSFEEDGQSLFYSTYLGGSAGDIGYDVILDNNSLVYVGGVTWSDDFPVVNPYQSDITGYVDGLVFILGADGQSLQYSTYLGSAYPAMTDVSLSDLTGTTSGDTNAIPSWLWLAFGLLFFFIASLFLGRIVGQHKNGQQK